MPAPTLSGFEFRVVVDIADLAVTNNQNSILTTYSLGSCLGITIYDPAIRVGGLVHVMLPDSSIDPVKAANLPAMFIDTGVPALFRSSYQFNAQKYRMVVCVAGGAQIMDNSGFFNIGKRNYEALCKVFQAHGLKIHAEQVGGLVSRSMYLNVATGEVRLKISGQEKEFVLCPPLKST
jgi:chemotaxis protein CheD